MSLKMIDLFAGIGGFRAAANQAGIDCVFTSEIDKFAVETYSANFSGVIHGDITKINESDIPDFDILCAGFPCQAFSISGKQLGFEDTRGTLIYDILRIIKTKTPLCVFLENVDNFEKHDGGRTFNVIRNKFEELGYTLFFKVLNSSDYGIPQSRKRIYLVFFRKDLGIQKFDFPRKSNKVISVLDILLDEKDQRLSDLIIDRTPSFLKEDFGELKCNKPIQIGKFNEGRQGERIYSIYGHAPTLSAYGGGIASKTGAYKVGNVIRKLHPIECARLQGFRKTFKIPVSNSQAWKQFGNSVSVPVIYKIMKKIISKLER